MLFQHRDLSIGKRRRMVMPPVDLTFAGFLPDLQQAYRNESGHSNRIRRTAVCLPKQLCYFSVSINLQRTSEGPPSW
jgi:hypothetical protein